MEQNNEQTQRITKTTAAFMIVVAVFFDLLQLLLTVLLIGIVLNPAIDVVAFLTFYLWFKLKGVSLTSSNKQLIATVSGYIVEIIPILNALPGITIATIARIIVVKTEDTLLKNNGTISAVVGTAMQKKVGADDEVSTSEKSPQEKQREAFSNVKAANNLRRLSEADEDIPQENPSSESQFPKEPTTLPQSNFKTPPPHIDPKVSTPHEIHLSPNIEH
jgi:hypothetical protein